MVISNSPIICKTCTKRKQCNFGQELERALHGLGSMVSKEARAQIQAIVAKDIGCGDYQKEES